jgi:hypothetical protein
MDYMEKTNSKFDAVLTTTELSVLMTSYLASELGCLAIPFDVAQTVTNKYDFRKYCKRLGIVTPKFSLIEHDDRLKRIELIDDLQKKELNFKRNSTIELNYDGESKEIIVNV